MPTFTTKEIAEKVDGELVGPGDLEIHGVESMDRATAGDITFISVKRYANQWSGSRAAAALVTHGIDVEPVPDRALINVADAELAMAIVLEMFSPPISRPDHGVHPSAVVDPSVTLGERVAVGPQCYLGPGVRVGAGSVLQANATILDHSTIGAGCMIWPGVVIRERTEMGDGCIVHPNVTIGADGYGYRPAPDGRSLVKIPQIGYVRLGDGVELGAGTCVDRGKFSATVIGDGTKIDNLCQIAHNAQIGRSVIVAGLTGIGGSVVVEDGVIIAGGCHIKDHVTIGAGAKIGGSSSLTQDVPPGEVWQGCPAHDGRAAMREHAAIRRLPQLIKDVRQLQARTGEGPSDA